MNLFNDVWGFVDANFLGFGMRKGSCINDLILPLPLPRPWHTPNLMGGIHPEAGSMDWNMGGRERMKGVLICHSLLPRGPDPPT